MLKIFSDCPKKEYYDFICRNFPWQWGNFNLFKWKHIDDPYREASDFFLISENNQIKALCVGRVYPFVYKGMNYKILSMMDFVTEADSREKGYMTILSDFIKEQVSCDFSIGFSSEKLFNTVYKSKNCLQIYYRYEFTSDCVLQNVEPQELNIHPFALNPYTFRIIANDEYVHYIKRSCKYEKISLVQDGSLSILIGIMGSSGVLLDISNYSEEDCYHAVEMVKPYCKIFQIDFPNKISAPSSVFVKSTCVVIDGHFKKDGDSIWIPVLDRK